MAWNCPRLHFLDKIIPLTENIEVIQVMNSIMY